ncbi:MAG: TIGR01777 family oxidoreductase [Bdellovibrionaceae bacterium]|nr:TIGR01777 family oxidoreductase [Pseudobdellovibrionaceae bacterium]
MKVLMTGATGLIGSRLGYELVKHGHQVTVLARDSARARLQLPFPCEIFEWKDVTQPIPAGAFEGIEGILNRAGEPIADERWSEERKRRIHDSRVLATRALVDGVLQQGGKTRLQVFVNGSAIGIYGDRNDEILDESSRAGDDFLARVCLDWEDELTRLSVSPQIRVVRVRTGIVLAAHGGALAKLIPVFEGGLGGRLASGRQWMSWIHIDDIVGLFRFSLETPSVSGPINGVATHPVRNADFAAELAEALGTAALLPTPRLALKAVFGELADTLLGGARVANEKTITLGYNFRFHTLREALKDLLGARREGYREVVFEQWFPVRTEDVFAFFSDERNLEAITPPFLNFKVLGKSTPALGEGTLIDYRLRLRGVPVKWRTRIDSWQPGRCFVDSQLKGPYETWRHTHEFEPLGNGTLVRDRVRYRLPLGRLGSLAAGLMVARDVQSIFNFRRKKIGELLA